jgi:hypothetical protein
VAVAVAAAVAAVVVGAAAVVVVVKTISSANIQSAANWSTIFKKFNKN